MTAKYWIGGTGNWSDPTHWSTATGGANNTTKPTALDIANFDAASGAGVVTVNEAISCQSIVCGTHTGTINVGANNVTLTGTGTAWFNGAGSGTRTFNAGSGTWTLTGAGATFNMWNMATVTGLTPTFSNCTIVMENTSALAASFAGGGLTYGTVMFTGHANKGGYLVSGTNTFTTLNATGPTLIQLPNGVTTTITNTLDITGTSGNYIFLVSSSGSVVATIGVANADLEWCALRGIAVSGAGTHAAINTNDLGGNTGWETLTAPTGGGGAHFSGFAG